MEKLNLLEKLKTLKQWQLQQQLDFEKMKKNNENINNEDKENTNHSKLAPIQKNMFEDTMNSDTLGAALKEIDLNTLYYYGEDATPSESSEVNLQNRFIQSGGLNNWNMSGMQTVVFNGPEPQFKLSESTEYNHSNSETLEGLERIGIQDVFSDTDSDAGFSDTGTYQFHVDGVQPLSETEEDVDNNDDNIDYHDCENDDHDDVKGKDEDDEDDEGPNEDEEECDSTVIEINLKNFDDQPISSPFKERNKGLTFEQIIEKEVQKEALNMTASTPIKKPKQNFLRRGEGLKRFSCGNSAKLREEAARKKQEHKKSGKKTRSGPGLPLKLNTKKTNSSIKSTTSMNKGNKLKNNSMFDAKKDLKTILSNKSSNSQRTLQQIPSKQDMPQNHSKPRDEQQGHVADHPFGKQMITNHAVTSSFMDSSFQRMLTNYQKREEFEENELDMFEALEEAAENVSLSSNSSLVAKLLGKKKNQDKPRDSAIASIDEIEHEENNHTAIENVVSDEDMQHLTDSVEDFEINNHHYDEFDDGESWSDTSQISSVLDKNDDTVIQVDEEDEGDGDEEEEIIEPPKRIISRKKNSPDQKHNLQAVTSPRNDIIENSDVSETVKRKLLELESEISKFRLENDKLSKLRIERESELKKLRKEIDEFQAEKTEELERINLYRDEETKKLKTERKIFDKYQKATRAIPNKQEREEIKALQEELTNVQEELKSRESRWNAATHRFRSRISDLEEENNELRQEICFLEKERLQRRKDNEKSKARMKSQRENTQALSTNQNFNSSPPIQQYNAYFSPKRPGENKSLQKETTRIEIEEMNKLIPNSNSNSNSKNEVYHDDGKIEMTLADGSRLITFPNGTKKTISHDGNTISVMFFNGDSKKILPDERIVYYYAESQTTHTTYTGGLEVLEFPNEQIEKRHPNGETEITFPDKTVKRIALNGSEETVFIDGTIQKVDTSGVKTILFSNGQKEIHTKQYKKREYPNGTVKTVYEDGRQETKYSNGRLRVKDKDGSLLIDTVLVA